MLSAEDKKLLTEIARTVNHHPLLLKLANGLIREEVETCGRTLSNALQFVAGVLQHRGIHGLDIGEAVVRMLDLTLSRLQQEDYTRCLQLAIFPMGAEVPYQTLEKLWTLDAFETERLSLQLKRLGVVQSITASASRGLTTIRLSETMSAYLRSLVGGGLPEYHRDFVAKYRRGAWSKLPDDEPYLWDRLFYHLAGGAETADLVTTIKDVLYITRKITLRGILGVEQDMLTALDVAPDDRQLRLWCKALTNFSHMLSQSPDARDIVTNLYSRCAHIPELMPLLRDVPHLHLTAVHPLPDQLHPALIRTLEEKGQAIRYAMLSPGDDSEYIVASYAHHMVRVWSTRTGRLIHSIKDPGDKTMGRCYYSPDGEHLLVLYLDGRVKLWETNLWEQVADWQIAPTDTSITKAAFHPDGRHFATIDYGPHTENDVKLWHIETQTCIMQFVGHTKALWHIEFTADGAAMVTSSDDLTIRLWDVHSGVELHRVESGESPISSMRFSPDGRYLLCADNAGHITLRNAATLTEIYRTPNAHTNIIRDLTFSKDGQYFFTGSFDETIKMWETQTGRPQATLTGHLGEVRSLQMTADGVLLVSSSADGTIKLWDPFLSLSTPAPQDIQPEHAHTSWVTSCAFNPTGQLLATTSKDKTVKLWDVQTGQVIRTLEGHQATVMGCAFHPLYDILISVAGNPRQQDNTLRVWNVTEGTEIRNVSNPSKGWFLDCAFSPDGGLALTTSGDLVDYDNYTQLWDVGQVRLWQSFAGHTEPVYSGTFSADGRRVLTCSSDGTLLVMETENGRRIHQLTGHRDSVYAGVFSADGRWIASASADGTARLWNAQTGTQERLFKGHTQTVWGCAFSPSAEYLATVSEDRTLKVWSVETGECLTTLYTNGFMLKCRWEENGDQIVAVGEKGVYFLRFVAMTE